MNKLRIAINGFGRIGRLTFRQIVEEDAAEIVAVNDLTDPSMLAYLLKYDSIQGTFSKDVSHTDRSLTVNSKDIPVFAEKDPARLPWKKLDVDLVLECTGLFTTKEKASAHLRGGAKKVVISAPADSETKTIVFNVNHDILNSADKVISCASCTTNCLAPMAKALNDHFGIATAQMITIHAYTNSQPLMDTPNTKNKKRVARAAATNVVPHSTGAAKAIGLVIPELKGKLDGMAQRIPVHSGSLTELYSILNKKTDVDTINQIMKSEADESYGYTEDEIVSSDVIGMKYGSLFDATLTKVVSGGDQQLVKTAAWYDNEMSYVSQLVRTAQYFGKL